MKNIAFIIFLLFISICRAQDNNILFQNYNVSNGLSQNTVIRSLEDSNGVMWFCTRDGLNRFDGTEFEVFRADGQPHSLSSSDVTTIIEESPGVLWIGTHSGLNRYDVSSNTFTQYFHDPANQYTISDNCIKHLLCDNQKRIWVGSMKGLNLYNKETDDFIPISTNGSVFWLMQNSQNEICYLINNTLCIMNPVTYVTERFQFGDEHKIYFLYEDNDKRLWVGMWDSGLKWFDRKNRKLVDANLTMENGKNFNNSQVNYIVETLEGNLMLATREGVLIYDRQANRLINYYQREQSCGLSENTIISLYRDKANNIWIGTYGGGVNLYTPYSNFFIPHKPEYKLQKSIGNINAIVEYKEKLWLGTDGGLIIYNPKDESYEYCPLHVPRSVTNNEVKYIQKEGDHLLWISIYYCGLYLYDMETRRIIKEIPDFPYNQVRRIAKGTDNIYWIALGVDSPILRYHMENNQLEESFPVKGRATELSIINVQDLKAIGPYIWMGTRAAGLYRYHTQTHELKHFGSEEKSPEQFLPSNHVSTLYTDASENLWIGTYGGGIGLYNNIKESFTIYNEENGLPNNAINSIVADNNGKLWVSTLKGMSCFDPKSETFTNWDNKNGYSLLETNLHACLKSSSNIFYVGGNNHFLSFNPQLIRRNTFIPPVYITKMRIWADYLEDNKAAQWVNISNQRIKLRYNQTSFTIKFSALSYVFASNNKFSYMLEGFDKGWSEPTHERSVNYTNIPPGKYVFKVRACNNDGIWSNGNASLSITVTPPLWKTWYAYLFYLAFTISMIMLFIRYKTREAQLKMDLQLKQMEKQNIEISHNMGVQMFTNFSHELRTPLTVIIAPLTDLLHKEDMPPAYRQPLELINRNSQRLLWLVNRLMDFHKLEAGKMQLHVSNYNLGTYIPEIIKLFMPVAEKKNISIEFNDTTSSTDTWFDAILLEKVFFNLLSNSLKHTPNGGYIIISSMETNTEDIQKPENLGLPAGKILLIKVEDSGSGIPANMMPRIFEAFFQAGEKVLGSGIGLNLTKSIIELHGGRIWIDNKEGHGMTVSFTLPLGKDSYTENQLLSKDKIVKSTHAYSDVEALIATDVNPCEISQTNTSPKEMTLLIIEDNEDVRNYLVSLLSKYYNIYTAVNCKEGYEIEQKQIPDLVISDIMTPYMDGIEFTRLSKNNMVTSHIPIILLTARVTSSQVREGYESLADDYIMKPFDPELLVVRVANLLINRKKLAERYGTEMVSINREPQKAKETSVYSAMEEKFMKKVMEIINKNIENPAYSIDQFSEEIGMSRVQVYRKIKAVTGMSPSKLILDIRLKTSLDMLQNTEYTVTEVSYRCGFNEISYFGKCFKTEYGLSPSEYIKKYRK